MCGEVCREGDRGVCIEAQEEARCGEQECGCMQRLEGEAEGQHGGAYAGWATRVAPYLSDMAKKQEDWRDALGGLVYSSGPSAPRDPFADDDDPAPAGPPPSAQTLYVAFEKKHRAGKPVTIVENFAGTEAELEALGRALKQGCGVGGSVKDGVILVQGDCRKKVTALLEARGFRTKQKGG